MWGIGLAIILFLAVFFIFDFGEHKSAQITAGVAVLMSALWITEAIPLAATSLIPLILFPLLGVLDPKITAGSYINSTIFLFIGGFLIAIAMEKWNLHRRIALFLIKLFGTSPSTIILGFMIAAAGISMWISNTATAVMLLPIGMAILKKVEEQFGSDKTKNFAVSLLLGIAYGCSIGGIATLIGTPPNLVFQRVYSITFPGKPEIFFSEWMMYGFPLSIVMLIIVWFLLTKVFYKPESEIKIEKSLIDEEHKLLGAASYEEKVVLTVFSVTAFLWIFRGDIVLGGFIIPGWTNLLPSFAKVEDATVGIAMAILLFVIPSKFEKRKKAILTVTAFRKLPWEIILLFGGGFALAEGFVQSGLSQMVSSYFSGMIGIPPVLVIFLICISVTFLTELTSNTATAQIILPILAALAVELNVNPFLFMIPATLSASMAFMMPVATPPNAIVFGGSRLKVLQMAKAGIFINILGAVLITLWVYYILDL
ncbi:MAG: SLC13 family permease [Melioribacteraceae bacterium]|nr:SLC13 family permease [Melioribacteraceae bacterium]MCF8355130.1 SLC13 family permease [Melioribacteraceae bacterium]MCF8392393.1 SLC13 family permease [Melioribacteraceae bacterium]MCF8417914.1 SLC13 family permease [Melioribacteraceae bacterium]